MYPHGVGGDLEGRLRGEQLGHASLHVDPFTGVGPTGGVIGHEPGRLELGGHLGQLELDRLVLEYRPTESLALLGVAHCSLEGCLGHADRTRRHVDPPQLECAEGVATTLADALLATQHVAVRDPVVHVGHLDGLEAPVAQLVDLL